MINETIEQHKLEKEKIISKQYIEREQIIRSKKYLQADLIKVITGPRRAGKSIFAFLMLKDKNFAYINFEDENLFNVKNYDDILAGLFQVYKNPEFILFDEIQNLNNWEPFINKLHRRNYNLILTGSNAKLLSKELSSSLTGRYIPIEILPFSFLEYLKSQKFSPSEKSLSIPENKGKLLNLLRLYLENGGYPEVSLKDLEAKSYLGTLFDAVLLKDVVKRYEIRFPQEIYNLALYLISNFCSEYTFNNLRESLNFNSTNTIQKYLYYLEEIYLFVSLNRFSFKIKEQIKTPRKIYLIDNGFAKAKTFQVSVNIGRLIENSVFIHLLRRGYKPNQELFYYKTRNNKEIDFVLLKGLKIDTLIQVCYEINSRTKKREIEALIEAGEELKCKNMIVVTYDFEGIEKHNRCEIIFTPLWKWLLEK